MMKKILIFCLLTIAFASFTAGCGLLKNDINQEEITIEMPEKDNVIPLPASVKLPAKPILPEFNPLLAPYIANFGSTTDAFTVTQIKNGDKLEGASISYPTSGKVLNDYNFIWFDVYNFSKEYSNIRIDFANINGAEKVAVAAYYMEQTEKTPAVGVMVESLMDGALSFVTNLKDFKTINKDYIETKDMLAEKTVARLYIYIDTNPAQRPLNKIGSLDIEKIRFIKDGDELTTVDNSPKLGEVVASSNYSLVSTQNVFKANYATNNLENDSSVIVPVNRFSAAYGKIRIEYQSSNVQTLTLTDGSKELSGIIESNKQAIHLSNYKPKATESIIIDIRAWTNLSDLHFYIDSKGSVSKNSTLRTFEIISIDFIETPYASDSWSATSKMVLSDNDMGGKIKAVYDIDIGFDFLSVQVRHWNPSFNQMVVKFKTYGSNGNGAERFGLSVNSNNVILQVEDNKVSDLSYDSDTQEYIMLVDLSSIKKLVALNFYFDSWKIEDFIGTRTVEFTSIDFEKVVPEMSIGQMNSTLGFNVTNSNDKSATISWIANREGAYTYLTVKNYESEFKTLEVNLTNNGTNNISLKIYQGNWNDSWGEFSILPDETKMLLVTVPQGFEKTNYDLWFFWDLNEPTIGNVKINSIKFHEIEPVDPSKPPKTGIMQASSAYLVKNNSDSSINLAWDSSRTNVWDPTLLNITNYSNNYKYLKLTLISNDNITLAITADDIFWFGNSSGHTAINFDEGTQTIYIEIPNTSTLSGGFNLSFYWDIYVTTASRNIAIQNIEFLEVLPDIPKELTIGKMGEFESNNYEIINNPDKSAVITWTAGTRVGDYSYTTVKVSNYTENYKYLKLVINSQTNVKLAVYEGTSVAWKSHTEIISGTDVEWYITIPNTENLAESFNLAFFWDSLIDSSGSVTVKSIEFLENLP